MYFQIAGKVRHLQARGWRYEARVSVLRALREIIGQPEFVEGLGADRRNALNKPPAAVAKFKAQIAQARAQRNSITASVNGPPRARAMAELEAGLIGDRTKKALAAAKANGIRLGNPRNLKHAEAGRVNGRAARTKIAAGRATDLAPIIAELQASGATSLREIAASLNERGIRTSRGGAWSAVQVARVIDCIHQ